jgi:hypothetical protein
MQATVYYVNRSFEAYPGGAVATLTGTLEIPLGNYTIQSSSASPFIDVNLTLTVIWQGETSFHLVNAFTDNIYGTGQFLIDATSTALTFSTANADGGNPADLVFSDSSIFGNRYVIGYDGSPGFEALYTNLGYFGAGVNFPTVFATAVPEPKTLLLLGAPLLLGFLASVRRRANNH